MVRPIDLQDNFSKASGESKVQQAQQANPEIAHQNTAAEMAQQQLVDQSRTAPAQENDRAEMNPDDSGKEQSRKRNTNKVGSKKEEVPGINGPPKRMIHPRLTL